MKISYHWLKEHIDTALPPEDVADILTRTGLEIDEHYPSGVDPDKLNGLLVGYVEAVEEHPNADKLQLTKVDIGAEELLPIVCGAPNVESGQKVIVAPPGTTVHPLEGEPLKIKKTKIRGELSQGMICSAAEIGTSEDREGIMVLDPKRSVGSPVKELFQDEGDHLFEIDITPNRADAISVLGVARDLDAYLKVHEGRSDRKKLPEPDLPKIGAHQVPIEVQVKDEKACPRYCGLSISGVTVAPSPKWLQDKLKSIGAEPINNVVDVTNYVLHDIGQPLHAFDARAVKGKQVFVQKLPSGTPFKTLDGEERKLDGSELMICNGEREGMCMAGVLGGSASGVDEGTSELFLESASFDRGTIRRGSSRHGISTEASFRFERGVDPEITRYALERAASLILELAGGNIASELQDTRPEGFEWDRVPVDHDRIADQVGEAIEPERVRKILEALEMEFEKEDLVRIPPYRIDVSREADLLEEILRIHGYDRIELPGRLRASISHTSSPDRGKIRRKLSDMLAANGFTEIVSNSLVHSENAGALMDPDQEVRVLNPISSELDVLRQSLLHSGLPVMGHNIKRKETELRYFEFGKVYWKGAQGYAEEERLALYLSGRREPENWRNKNEALSYFDLKGCVLQTLDRLGVTDKLELGDRSSSYVREGASFALKTDAGRPLVHLGELTRDLAERWDIDQPVWVAEFRLETLFDAVRDRELSYEPLSKHLAVRKDMAFILDQGVRFEALRQKAFEAEHKLLKDIGLFDVYEGEKLGKGKKSYAMKFIFQDVHRTLEDKDIERAMESISTRFKEAFGAELRDH